MSVLVLLAAASGAPAADDLDYPLADFTLTDADGRKVSRDDLRGKVWVGSFVLMRCPDGKCPQVTQTMRRLQSELPARNDLLLVTFTIDPDRDSPGEVRHYAEANGADPSRWLFLHGPEGTIDALMRSAYLRARGSKDPLEHALRLIVVDKDGVMRGTYLGLKGSTGDAEADERFFEADLRKLRRQVGRLLGVDEAWPRFNATLNATSGLLLVLGWWAIRRRFVRLHVACMVAALAVSAAFLGSYLYYHLVVKSGVATRFAEQAPGAPPWVAWVYFAVLLSHTVLAAAVAPMALATAYLGVRNRLAGHVRLARWTLPIWLYVSVTGVAVYWMLYRLYPLD